LHKLGPEVLKRKLMMVGTVQKNKPELPPQLLNARNRPKFVFTANSSLVSFMPNEGKNVVLMSMLHRDGRICGQEHQKTEIIMD
jgi:hypothetical protein